MMLIEGIIDPKKGRTYATNLDEYKSIGTNWIALYVNDNNVA